MNKLQLFDVPVPIATDTYSPVSHQAIIETVEEQLYKRNMQITGEKFNVAASGNKVIGYYDLMYDNNPEMGMRLAFRNSYDKSMSVAFVAGAVVAICSNGAISGEIQYVRKHTGGVAKELELRAVASIEQLEDHFIKMQFAAERMKSIELSKPKAAEMYGRMFMIEDILNTTQLSIVKRELEESQFEPFREETLWSAYNHATFALKQAHPMEYMQKHINLHKFVESEFQLV